MRELLALFDRILEHEPEPTLRIAIRKAARHIKKDAFNEKLARKLREQLPKFRSAVLSERLARLLDTMTSDSPYFQIDRIVGMRLKDDERRQYLVRWDGYGSDDDTWEPMEALVEDGCGDLIERFHDTIRHLV